MVGRRIDEILAEKVNARNGNFYLAPIVVPVVSSFKRIYKRRLSKSGVFKGKPLHTIAESSESSQNELMLQTANEFINEDSDTQWNNLQNNIEDDDGALTVIRYLFDFSEDRILDNTHNTQDTFTCFSGKKHFGFLESASEHSNTLSCSVLPLASPSASLMQQFELAAKAEAAVVIQQWYRQARERRRFVRMKQSAIIIQRSFRKRLKLQ